MSEKTMKNIIGANSWLVLILLIAIAIFCSFGSLIMAIIFWALVILQIIYIYRNKKTISQTEKNKRKKAKEILKKQERERIRKLKFTIKEWIAIAILLLIIIGLISLYL